MKDLFIKKLYYTISEVSKLTSVEQYILRYWETEFEQLKPQKNRAGKRIYTNKDIDIILKIRTLLRDKKFTIEGAKKNLNSLLANQHSEKNEFEKNSNFNNITDNILDKVNCENISLKKDLIEIRNLLLELYSKL